MSRPYRREGWGAREARAIVASLGRATLREFMIEADVSKATAWRALSAAHQAGLLEKINHSYLAPLPTPVNERPA